MPIDQSTQPAAGTTRRTFLVRSAVGGAVAAAGVAGPALAMAPFALPFAGAQASSDDLITDGDYATFAIPLELAAVQSYEQALDTGLFDDDGTKAARAFQAHHQAVATQLAELLDEGADAPLADAQVASQTAAAITGAGDAAALAGALAQVEGTLAATHLAVIEDLRDSTTARTVAQVAGAEAQQAAYLGTLAGTAIDALTPAEASTDDAIAFDAATPDSSATTTTGADATTTTD